MFRKYTSNNFFVLIRFAIMLTHPAPLFRSFQIFCIFFIVAACAEEVQKPADAIKAEPLKAESAKPKRQIYSLGYGHHAPLVSHASYIASAPYVHHAAPIVHHAAPLVHHASYVSAPIVHHAAPIVSHAPIVHAASSYSVSHQVHHPVVAHAPLISHAPIVSHAPLYSYHHYRR